ncbi:MAG: N-acetyl-gamma-glutamyl-phosphate reductase, partial [Proteobacteria bacterium]|nr:N-acetyl-gamma-glutamyl-phosphate reductase [Pseudomonadota bacterium]
MINVAVVGARGYVGFELLKLLDKHPKTKVVAAHSRAFEGKTVHSIIEGFSDIELCYRADKLEVLSGMSLDVIFLALPNGLAKKNKSLWQDLSKNVCIIDLSSDFRFDAD